MKRCNEIDLNTADWWDELWGGPRGTIETNPCPDVLPLLMSMSRDKETYLDLGCGTGRYFPWVLARDLYGLDISPWAIKKAQKNHPDASFTAIDIMREGINFMNETVDMVYCGEMLEHVEEPQKLVDEIRRVLKPGGAVLLNTPYGEMIPADSHLWFFDAEDLREMFSVFSRVSLMRFSNSPKVKWEHFMVVAIK